MKIFTIKIPYENDNALDFIQKKLTEFNFSQIDIKGDILYFNVPFLNKYSFNFQRDMIAQADSYEISYNKTLKEVEIKLFAGPKIFFVASVLLILTVYLSYDFREVDLQGSFIIFGIFISILCFTVSIFTIKYAFKKMLSTN